MHLVASIRHDLHVRAFEPWILLLMAGRYREGSQKPASRQSVGGSGRNVFKQHIELGEQFPAGGTGPRRHLINDVELKRFLAFALPQFIGERDEAFFESDAIGRPSRMRDTAMRHIRGDALLKQHVLACGLMLVSWPIEFRRK